MTNLHDLIRRMADELDWLEQMQQDDRSAAHPLAIEARAALAEPQGKGPTDKDLVRLAGQWVCVESESAYESIELAFAPNYARAVLARWGRPAHALPLPSEESTND